jgi:ribonuclease J
MRFCIHRGGHEIGGNCVEVESQGHRIVLDVGLPLDVVDPDTMELHPVPGFDKPDPSLLGVIISHPHQDHYGLAYRLPEESTFLIGGAARSILEAADDFTPAGLKLKKVIHLENRRPIVLGPFTITPYLVDHSAYDSYAVLVEADGKRLFYSGDFRAHGRKRRLVEELITDPPMDVNILLMEGTTLGRPESEPGFPTEDELVERFIGLFKQTDGLVLVWASGQNIDRLVTLYKACRRARRQLILDVYTAHVLRATGNDRIPQADWREIKVFLPDSQKMRIIRNRSFELSNVFRPYRIFPERIPAEANRSVMLFRPSMIRELDKIEGLKIGRLICSVWGGYLKDDRNKPLLDWLQQRSIPLDYCHTSGHADIASLRRFREAFASAVMVPVHSMSPATMATMFMPSTILADGDWLDLGGDKNVQGI